VLVTAAVSHASSSFPAFRAAVECVCNQRFDLDLRAGFLKCFAVHCLFETFPLFNAPAHALQLLAAKSFFAERARSGSGWSVDRNQGGYATQKVSMSCYSPLQSLQVINNFIILATAEGYNLF